VKQKKKKRKRECLREQVAAVAGPGRAVPNVIGGGRHF
jgi:hypothetical protein